MEIINKSDVADWRIQKILNSIRIPKKNITLIIKKSNGVFSGYFSYARNQNLLINVLIGDKNNFPFLVTRNSTNIKKGYATNFILRNQTHALAYLLYHEFNHAQIYSNYKKRYLMYCDSIRCESLAEEYALRKIKEFKIYSK